MTTYIISTGSSLSGLGKLQTWLTKPESFMLSDLCYKPSKTLKREEEFNCVLFIL